MAHYSIDLAAAKSKDEIFAEWWATNKAALSPTMRRVGSQVAAEIQNDGVGDIWSDIKNKFLSKAGDAVKQLTDSVGKNAPDVAKAAAEYQLIKENIKRINEGRPTINVSEATGFGDIKTLAYVGIGGLLLLKFLGRKRRG